MSGSAALAAARRRRAGPPQSTPQPSKRPNSNAKKNLETPENLVLPQKYSPQSEQLSGGQADNGKVHPLVMLMQHNTIISNMQAEMDAMKEHINQQNVIKKKMEAIEERLNSELNMNSINFFKKKYEIIKKQLEEIKKLIIKIQTFSMETNLQVIDVKKRMNENTSDLVNNEKNSESVSNIITTNVVDEIIQQTSR